MKFYTRLSLLVMVLFSAACQMNSAEQGASVEDLTPVYTSIPASEEATEEATQEIQQLESTTPEVEVVSASNDLGIVSTPQPAQPALGAAITPTRVAAANTGTGPRGSVDSNRPTNICTAYSPDGSMVNIRRLPSTDHEIVGALHGSDWIPVMGYTSSGWYHVDPAGTGDGWMMANLLLLDGPCANLLLEANPNGTMTTPTPLPSPVPTYTPTVVSEFCFAAPANSLGVVNIRKEPSAQFDAVNAFGEPVVVHGKTDNGWYLVRMYAFGNQFGGYVLGSEVSLTGNCSQLTLVPQSSAPLPLIEHQLPEGTTEDQVVIPVDMCTLTSSSIVNIYSSNSPGSNVVGRLHPGPWITVNGQDGAGWFRVTMINGGLAWINGAEVYTNGPCETVPTM